MAKRPTVKEIAKKLGISPSTVSFVLNNREKGISDATKKRVFDMARKLGYMSTAASLYHGWTRVAFISSNIEYFNFATSFFAGVYNHLQQKSIEHKIELFLLEIKPDSGAETVYQRIQEIKSLGMEVFLSSSTQIISILKKYGLRCILVQGGTMPDTLSIYCDDFAAGQEAAKHALEMGHNLAGVIFPHQNSPRFKGFLDVFLKEGGECPEEFRWFVNSNHDDMIREIGRLSSRKILPTLFYCFADHLLFPAIKAFAGNGLNVPEDISLIGTDNLYWGKLATPSFTTVDLREELFAEKLIEAITHVRSDAVPYHLAVPVRLVKRETVKRMMEE